MSTLYEKNTDNKIAKYGQNLHKNRCIPSVPIMTYLQPKCKRFGKNRHMNMAETRVKTVNRNETRT